VAKLNHRATDVRTQQEVAEERIMLEYQDVDVMKVAKKSAHQSRRKEIP
jgi:hypothetical protein